MGLKLKTPPGSEPITVAEAKLHCKVDGTDEDSWFSSFFIPQAREQAEQRTGRALVTQEWEYSLDRFPADSLTLPLPPLVSVASITYLDGAGVRQTLSFGDYQVITDELQGRVIPGYGKCWPACREWPGSVLVTFTAGYGNASAVPSGIKSWMLLAIATLYANREVVIDGQTSELPRDFFAGLLDPHLVPRL